MKCIYCNQNHPEGTKFCPSTGRMLLSLVCHNCKKSIPVDSVFCPFCGKKQLITEVTSYNISEAILDTTLCHDKLSDLLEYDFLDTSVVSNVLSDDEFIHKIDRRYLSEGYDGEMTVTLQYKHIHIIAVVDDDNSISKIIYKNISFGDLCTMFHIPNDIAIANSEELRSILCCIEKVDGDDFIYSDYDDDLLFYLRFKRDGSIRYMIVEKYRDKSFWFTVFPLNGVVLGETSIGKLGKKHKLTHEGSEIQCKCDGIVYSSSSNNRIDMITIENCEEMPEKLKEYGFDWYMSYDEYKDLFREKRLKLHMYLEPPKVISKKGRYMLYATMGLSLDEVVDCELIFDMGNKNGEGCSTSSHNSLYQIVLSYMG